MVVWSLSFFTRRHLAKSLRCSLLSIRSGSSHRSDSFAPLSLLGQPGLLQNHNVTYIPSYPTQLRYPSTFHAQSRLPNLLSSVDPAARDPNHVSGSHTNSDPIPQIRLCRWKRLL
jgi:hypothetical protein